MRLFLVAIFLFVANEVHAQDLKGFVARNTPAVVKQVSPIQVVPQVPAQALVPKELDHVVKEGEKLFEKGVEAAQAGPPMPGSGIPSVKVDCPIDKLLSAATSLENLAKEHTSKVKEFNDEMARTAQKVGDAQLNIIKTTTEEAGKILLKPFEPLVQFAKKFIDYYNTIMNNIEYYGIRIIAVAGVVLGFMVGLPFFVLIRAITPRRRAA